MPLQRILMWLVRQQHDDMKTVSFDDEAYELLKGAKLPGESFSDVVKRKFGGRRDGLAASFGSWKDMPPDLYARLKKERADLFRGRG